MHRVLRLGNTRRLPEEHCHTGTCSVRIGVTRHIESDFLLYKAATHEAVSLDQGQQQPRRRRGVRSRARMGRAATHHWESERVSPYAHPPLLDDILRTTSSYHISDT